MMNANMRYKLANSVRYHQELADQYKAKCEAAQKAPTRRHRDEAPAEAPAKSSIDEYMRDLHTEVAKQLQAIIDAEPVMSGVDMALASRDRVMRNARAAPPRGRMH